MRPAVASGARNGYMEENTCAVTVMLAGETCPTRAVITASAPAGPDGHAP